MERDEDVWDKKRKDGRGDAVVLMEGSPTEIPRDVCVYRVRA